jgi:hypothetical protein
LQADRSGIDDCVRRSGEQNVANSNREWMRPLRSLADSP